MLGRWLPCCRRSLQGDRRLLFRSDVSHRADSNDAMPRQHRLPTRRHDVLGARPMLLPTLRSRFHRRAVLCVSVRTRRCAVLGTLRLLRWELRRAAGPQGVRATLPRRRWPYHVRGCWRGLRSDVVAMLQRDFVSSCRQRRDVLRRRPDSLNGLCCSTAVCGCIP
jgi:hypothetical protein